MCNVNISIGNYQTIFPIFLSWDQSDPLEKFEILLGFKPCGLLMRFKQYSRAGVNQWWNY